MLQYTNCPEILLLLLLSYFTERNGHLSTSAPVTLPSSLKAVSYSRVELGGDLICPVPCLPFFIVPRWPQHPYAYHPGSTGKLFISNTLWASKKKNVAFAILSFKKKKKGCIDFSASGKWYFKLRDPKSQLPDWGISGIIWDGPFITQINWDLNPRHRAGEGLSQNWHPGLPTSRSFSLVVTRLLR